MDESKKKMIMVIIVVVCLALAGAITFMTQSGGGSGIKKLTGQIWVKCSNPDCGATYEMDKKEFYEYVQKNVNPMNFTQVPALTCRECGEKSIYKAVKCEKCGEVFFEGAIGANDYSDRCPKCGHSRIEELRKQAGKK